MKSSQWSGSQIKQASWLQSQMQAEREVFLDTLHMQTLCSEYTVSKVCYSNKFNFILAFIHTE